MKRQYAAYTRVNKQVVDGEYVFPFSNLGHRGAPDSIPVITRSEAGILWILDRSPQGTLHPYS